MRLSIAVIPLLLLPFASVAQVKLPAIIRDSMVLQRDTKVNVWGWASPGEKVSVRFNGKTYKTKTDASGKWLVKLVTPQAGGPYRLEIKGKNNIILNNILTGDVWFCSGQSNMVHQMNIHDITYAKDIETANYPMIRQFLVPARTNLTGPEEDLPAVYWKPAVGEEVRPFSAVAYFFARQLYEKYKVPIGIINASVGGTPIEAWTSEEGLKDFSSLTGTIQQNKDTAYVNTLNRRVSMTPVSRKPEDKGLLEPVTWYDPVYIPKGWRPIYVPGYWEDQGIKDLNGVVWYRKEVNIPASMTGKPAKVFLGRIVDADELYINGTRVGRTTYQYPQRRYPVAKDVLKPGKNIFVVRITNQSGKGGFVPDKPYCIFSGNDTIGLDGTWHYKVGEVYAPHPGPPPLRGISFIHQPGALFNAMVAPVRQYGIKGFCWYQGESNAGRPEEYAKLLPALVRDWRNQWQQGALPFLYVQLPGFMEFNYLPSESNWAKLRESQRQALSVPNTAMVVAIDLGEWNDIHPDNKKDVGERLGLAAQKLAYGDDIVYSGPLFQSYTTENNRIVISFTHTGSGLMTIDGDKPAEFAIAGADKKFVWANAKIEGDKVIVWHEDIREPKYVRYAWADNPVNPNLYNKEGLPASPFKNYE